MSNMPPPPPGPPGPPPGYGSPQPGNQGAEHPKGTTVLVLGILGLVCCGLLGPVAWVMGHRARGEMAARPDVVWVNKGNVTAGWVLGIVGSVLLVLGVLYLIVVFLIIADAR